VPDQEDGAILVRARTCRRPRHRLREPVETPPGALLFASWPCQNGTGKRRAWSLWIRATISRAGG
jgi:hypothetical protein